MSHNLLWVTFNASDSTSDGHWHWYYKKLEMLQESENVNSDVRPEVLAQSGLTSFQNSSLFKYSKYFEFTLTWMGFRRDLKRIESFIRNKNINTVTAYEGGLRSALLFRALAIRNPEVNFAFNFFFGVSWANFLRSGGKPEYWFQNAFSKRRQKSLMNLFFSAETKDLAAYFSKLLGHDVRVNEIFTLVAPQTSKWKKESLWHAVVREVDELEFLQRFLLESHEIGILPKALAVQAFNGVNTASLSELAKSFETVELEIFTSALDSKDYEHLLGRSSVSILPNCGSWYSQSSSARFIDATALGCVPVTSQYSLGEGFVPRQAVIEPDPATAARRLSNLTFKQERSPDNLDVNGYLARLISTSEFPDVQRNESQISASKARCAELCLHLASCTPANLIRAANKLFDVRKG